MYPLAGYCSYRWFCYFCLLAFSLALYRSDQISSSVVSDSLRPHELQHARPPCPSPTSGVHSDSCPSSQWCQRVCYRAGGCDGCAKRSPRGATPHPRSGAEAARTPCPKGGGQEELPHVRGRGGGWEEIPHALKPEARGGGGRSYPMPWLSGHRRT